MYENQNSPLSWADEVNILESPNEYYQKQV